MTTAKLLANLRKTYAARDKAMWAVYAFATCPATTRFNECLALATADVRDTYLNAMAAHDNARRAGIDAGIWYEGTLGLLMWVKKRGRCGTVDYKSTQT